MIFDLLFYLIMVIVSYLLTEYLHVFNTNTLITVIAFYMILLVLGLYDAVERLEEELRKLRRR